MQTKLVLKQLTTMKLRFQPGATGPSGTLTVGTVTTGAPGSSVVITNVGTPTAAIFDITIPRGDVGATGNKGWSPILAVVTDSARRVLQVSDWTGGEGTKPATGDYIGASGLTPILANAVDIRGAQGPSGSVTDGDKGDVVVSSAGAVWTVDANAIDDTKLRDSAALTVIGRSANSAGDPADIAAGTDGHVLRRSGTTLGFGTVATAGIADDAATNAKLANMAVNTIKGRITSGTGDPEDLTAANVRSITGQSWIALADETLGANATSFTAIALGSYQFARFTLVIRPNASAASDFQVLWRLSTDGGSTFPSGASDYANQSDTGAAASAAAAASNNSSGFLTGSVLKSGTVPARVWGEFEKGTANYRASMQSKSFFYNGTSTQVYDVGASYSTLGAATHLWILGNVSNCFGIGSRLITEGLV